MSFGKHNSFQIPVGLINTAYVHNLIIALKLYTLGTDEMLY